MWFLGVASIAVGFPGIALIVVGFLATASIEAAFPAWTGHRKQRGRRVVASRIDYTCWELCVLADQVGSVPSQVASASVHAGERALLLSRA